MKAFTAAIVAMFLMAGMAFADNNRKSSQHNSSQQDRSGQQNSTPGDSQPPQ